MHLNKKYLFFFEAALLIGLLIVCSIMFINHRTYNVPITNNIWYELDAEVDCEIVKFELPVDLPVGSYTANISYIENDYHYCSIVSGDKQEFIKANPFLLSKNKNVIQYDFYATDTISDLHFEIPYSGNGYLEIGSIQVESNLKAFVLLIIVYLSVISIINIFLYSKFVNQHKNIILILAGFTILISLPVLMYGCGLGDDWGFHLARIESIKEGLRNGDFPVRMNAYFNDDYGYPVSIFYGDLLLYFPAILRIIGFSVISAYKGYIIFINLITVIITYFSFMKILKNNNIALVVTLAYVTSNYRLFDIYMRTAVGEYTALAFLPLIMMAIWNIYMEDIENKSYFYNSIYLALGFSGLLYTHLLSTEMVVFIVGLIAILLFKRTFRKNTIIVYGLSVLACVLLSASFIIPFLDYYIHSDVLIKETNLQSLLIQKYGVYINDYFSFFKNISGYANDVAIFRPQYTPGLVLVAAYIVAVIIVIRNNRDTKIKILLFIATFIMFLASNLFPWNYLSCHSKIGSFMAQIQFPWRYISILSVVLAMLLGTILLNYEHKEYANRIYVDVAVGCMVMFCFFLSQYTSCISQQHFIDSAELPQYTYSVNNPIAALSASEYLLKNTDINDLDYELSGENIVDSYIISEEGTDISIYVETYDEAYIDIPRFNYSYYVAVGDNNTEFAISNGYNNKIRININDAYCGAIDVHFAPPLYWTIASIISIMSMLGLIVTVRYNKRIRI